MEYKSRQEEGSGSGLRTFAAGQTIIEEGTPDDGCIYILAEGSIGVYKKGRLLRVMDEPGVMFGEMATILQSSRTATIRALTDCKISVYTGGIDRIVQQFPTITMKILTAMAQRVKDMTKVALDNQPDDRVPGRAEGLQALSRGG